MVYVPKGTDPFVQNESMAPFVEPRSEEKIFEYRTDVGFYEDLFGGHNPDTDIRKAMIHNIIQEVEMNEDVRDVGRMFFGLGSETYGVPYGVELSMRAIGCLMRLTETQVSTRRDNFLIALRWPYEVKMRLEALF